MYDSEDEEDDGDASVDDLRAEIKLFLDIPGKISKKREGEKGS